LCVCVAGNVTRTVDPVTTDSGWGTSPDGELGLEGIAEVVTETHLLGVLIPVVPCLLYSSRMLEGASIRRVSNLKTNIISVNSKKGNIVNNLFETLN